MDPETGDGIVTLDKKEIRVLGALMEKRVFLYVTPAVEGTFDLSIIITCTSNATLSQVVNVTLQAGFRETTLTLANSTGVYTDMGTVTFTLVDELGQDLLYPPHEIVIEYHDGTNWVNLLGGPYNLTIGHNASVSYQVPDVVPGDYPLRASYGGASRYGPSTANATLTVAKETPAPWVRRGHVQFTDGITIPYRPVCLGPTILKNLTTETGSPLSFQYANPRNSSIAFEQA